MITSDVKHSINYFIIMPTKRKPKLQSSPTAALLPPGTMKYCRCPKCTATHPSGKLLSPHAWDDHQKAAGLHLPQPTPTTPAVTCLKVYKAALLPFAAPFAVFCRNKSKGDIFLGRIKCRERGINAMYIYRASTVILRTLQVLVHEHQISSAMMDETIGRIPEESQNIAKSGLGEKNVELTEGWCGSTTFYPLINSPFPTAEIRRRVADLYPTATIYDRVVEIEIRFTAGCSSLVDWDPPISDDVLMFYESVPGTIVSLPGTVDALIKALPGTPGHLVELGAPGPNSVVTPTIRFGV